MGYDVGIDSKLLWQMVGTAVLFLASAMLWLFQIQRQKEKLRISEERFQMAMAAASDGLWDWDAVTGKVFYSPRWMTMLGYTPDELPQTFETFIDLLHPDDRTETLRKNQEMLDTAGEPYEQEFRLRDSYQNYRWILSRGRVFSRDSEGNALRAVGTHVDITNRKQIELDIRRLNQDLAESNKRFALAAQIVSMGVWELDIKANKCAWDDRMVEIYGISKTTPIPPDKWKKMVHPNDLPKAYASLEKVIVQGGQDQIEYRILRPDNTIRHIFAAHTVIKDDTNKPVRIVGVNWDITERKAAEAQFKDLINALPVAIVVTDSTGQILLDNPQASREVGVTTSLTGRNTLEFYVDNDERDKVLALLADEGRIKRRHVQYRIDSDEIIECLISVIPIVYDGQSALLGVIINLTDRIKMEQDLAEAKEAAEAASGFKSNFLANMSHEIRTPMNTIVGMSHLASLTDLNDKQQDYLNKIQSASLTLLNLIDDILDFSKIEAGRLTMESIDFNLDQVLENLADLFRLQIQEKQIELLFDINPNTAFALVGDPLRLQQVLTNLTSNALKFTNRGEIVIGVELLEQHENTARLLFTVKDTGVGIKKEQLPHLFGSFYQADASTTRTSGGTGLGLAISKKLVNMMNGEITVESEADKGSIFRFTAEFGVQHKTLSKKPILEPNLRGMSVLVVDDNPVALDILANMLRMFSLNVTAVSNGQAALEKISSRKQNFDLIIIDYVMPDMDGIETARAIKHDTSQIEMPKIIIITAYGRQYGLQQVNALHLDDYLVKPISPSTLLDSIINVFSNEAVSAHPVQNTVPIYSDTLSAKVLLVEDNEFNQQVAKELLEHFGLSVDIAAKGTEAITKISVTDYDLVFMDIQMPGMDGLEATRQIRQLGYTNLPIIALTAHAMVGDREKSVQAGMNDHMTKPIDPDALFRILQHWLKRDITQMLLDKPTAESNAVDLPDYSAAIDYAFGLARVGGNRNLFSKLLQDFCSNHNQDPERIQSAIEEQRLDEAKRIVHTLIGITGTIGAQQLKQSAEALYASLENNTLDSSALIAQDFAQKFRALIESLRFYQDQ